VLDLGLERAPAQRLPRVFQWNKRDLPIAVRLSSLREALNPAADPEFEAIASDGRGVAETLKSICKQVLARLAAPAAAPAPVPARAAVPPAPLATPRA
jgi:signal recognition particle receptor subunit beta